MLQRFVSESNTFLSLQDDMLIILQRIYSASRLRKHESRLPIRNPTPGNKQNANGKKMQKGWYCMISEPSSSTKPSATPWGMGELLCYVDLRRQGDCGILQAPIKRIFMNFHSSYALPRTNKATPWKDLNMSRSFTAPSFEALAILASREGSYTKPILKALKKHLDLKKKRLAARGVVPVISGTLPLPLGSC